MPPLVYSLAGGVYVIPALAVLIAAIVASAVSRRRWIALGILAAATSAVATIVASAVGMPWWFDITGAVLLLAWVGTGWIIRHCPVGCRRGARLAAFAVTLAAIFLQLDYERFPPPLSERWTTLTVIGDSITAGMGRRGETAWPALLRSSHHVQIVDLSRPGSTIAQAVVNAAPAAREPGVVLIEIGGNDMIDKVAPDQFERDLESLAQAVCGTGRTVVMFELPRLPFDDAYGLVQRRVAGRYRIALIPRRALAGILAGPGATVDGIHLSQTGQRQMANLVWKVIGSSMAG